MCSPLLCSSPLFSAVLCSALLCSAQHVENTFHCAKYTLQFHFSYSNRKNHPPAAQAKTLAIHFQNVFVLAALRFGLHATSVRERVLYYIQTYILYVVGTVYIFSLLRSQLSHAHLYVHINKSINTHAHTNTH